MKRKNAPAFRDLRIVDNFYQTSSFFPMPTILIGTLCEDGLTNLGSYSLCFPYYVAGRDYYSMILSTRNSSNTAQNLLRTGKCSLNFIPDRKKYFREAVRLGFPGETPQEKMKNCLFTMVDGRMVAEHPDDRFPKVVAESFQVFECTWMRELDGAADDRPAESYAGPFHDFNGITSPMGAHFILRVDKILMKERQADAIIHGITPGAFPRVPVDYGYRDSTHFWHTPFSRAHKSPVPKGKAVDVSVVKYAADRADDQVKFTDEACAKLVRVPRVFLNPALQGCVKWAKENGVTTITAEHMDRINDKRSQEKGR